MTRTPSIYNISITNEVLPIRKWAERNNKSLDLVNKVVCPERELSLWRIPRITVMGHGLLTTSDGVVLDESGSSYDGYESLQILGDKIFSSSNSTYLNGDFMCLYGRWSEGFYHWMMEWLPKAFLAEISGFNGFYVLKNPKNFMIESLLMIGINIERIAISPPEIWHCDNLWITETCHGGELEFFPEIIKGIRNRILQNVPPLRSDGRVYITRANPNRPRRIVNETDLINLLNKFSFNCIDMEGLPLAQQVANVAGAKVLVVPHGAGAVHSMFAAENSTIIELFSPNYINPCCLAIIKSLKQRYHPLVSLNLSGEYKFGDNIEAPINLIDLTLRHELGDY